jgi:hypothetical protein
MDAIEHDRFTLRIHQLTTPERAADPEWRARTLAISNAIHTEDIPPCQAAHKGALSPFYQPGPLSHLEASNWRFHRFLQSRLCGPPAA